MSDLKLAYPASSALTITLASLASDVTNVLAGRESTAWDNSSNKYLDLLIAGNIKLGTTPTIGKIEVWSYAQLDDAPVWPDTITGSDSNRTLTNRSIVQSGFRLVVTIPTVATSNVLYPFGPYSLAALYGGTLPRKGGAWVVHTTVAALNASGHAIYIAPVYSTIL